MRYLLYVFWLCVVLLGITFAGLNSESVNINYYVDRGAIALPLLILIILMIGALFGVIAMLPALIRFKGKNRHLKQRIRQSEQEVKNLRNIPIKDTH